MVKILKIIGFSGGDMDPCIFYKKSNKGIRYVALCVNDNLLFEHQVAIDDTIHQLKKHDLVLKIEDDLHYYLLCEIVREQFAEIDCKKDVHQV